MVNMDKLNKFIIVLQDILQKRRKMDQQQPTTEKEWRYYYDTANSQYDRLVDMISELLEENDRLTKLSTTVNVQ